MVDKDEDDADNETTRDEDERERGATPKSVNDGRSSCFFFARFFSRSWGRINASRSTGELGDDALGPPADETSDESDEDEALRESVVAPRATAEEVCVGLCQRQLHLQQPLALPSV